MEKSVDRQVEESLANFSGWGTIDDLVAYVSASITIPEEFRQSAVSNRLTSVIRRQIKARLGADGLAEFENVERHTENGETERIYKQLTLFDKEDFRLAIEYYSTRSSYCARKANSLTKRCNDTLKTRRPLPFPEFGFLADADKQKTA